MANLKVDLGNYIDNQKYYDEIELIRVAQEPNMNYKEKIKLMDELLGNIALANQKKVLLGEYFQPQQPQVNQQPQQQPVVQQGQSHVE